MWMIRNQWMKKWLNNGMCVYVDMFNVQMNMFYIRNVTYCKKNKISVFRHYRRCYISETTRQIPLSTYQFFMLNFQALIFMLYCQILMLVCQILGQIFVYLFVRNWIKRKYCNTWKRHYYRWSQHKWWKFYINYLTFFW